MNRGGIFFFFLKDGGMHLIPKDPLGTRSDSYWYCHKYIRVSL